MSLIRTLFWFAVFVAATLAFTVLFEHGPSNFVANAKVEMDSMVKMAGGSVERKGATDKLPR